MIGPTPLPFPRNASTGAPAGHAHGLKTVGIVKDGRFPEKRQPRAGKQPMSVIERGAFMSELAQTLSIPEGQTLKDLVQEYERQLLLMALELAGWNQRRVAACPHAGQPASPAGRTRAPFGPGGPDASRPAAGTRLESAPPP